MPVTFFSFKDLILKIDIPADIKNIDGIIATRCYEKVKGITKKDNKSKQIDNIIDSYKIKYNVMTIAESLDFCHNEY